MRSARVVLEDGTVLHGTAVGAPGVAAGEICFTTAMAGYQESCTDPSYAGQVLCFSYPLIGNYGVEPSGSESGSVWPAGVVMRTARARWARWLEARGTVAVEDVDTRRLVRHIRARGVLRCAVGEAPVAELHARALQEPRIDGRRFDASVATSEPYRVGRGPRVTVLDLGCKASIVKRLVAEGLEVVVVPGSWSAHEIMATSPGAVVIGNGPGDPAALSGPIDTVCDLLGAVELFGICLGHQLLALALGLRTFKLPFGHRGANHPVQEVATGRVLVTVQNHGYAVAPGDGLWNGGAEVSHVSLNDGTVEGLSGEDFASVQFHPEAAPGPLDAVPFFERIAKAARSCRSEQIYAAC